MQVAAAQETEELEDQAGEEQEAMDQYRELLVQQT
jgi:hypothetical protein